MLHAAGALGKQLPGARGGPEVRAPGSSEACSQPAPLRAVGGRRHSGVRPLTVPARGGAPGPAWASPVTVQGG